MHYTAPGKHESVGERPVRLVHSEELVGARQHVLDVSILADRGAEARTLTVNADEGGRAAFHAEMATQIGCEQA
jgi:hypothetical protein